MDWRLLDLGTINPRSYIEMYKYEILEREVDRIPDTVLFMSPTPFIWVGEDAIIEEAINLSVAKTENMPIVETLISGGVLVLNNSFIWNFIGKPSTIMPSEKAWKLLKLAQTYALKPFGLTAKMTEKNDLLVNGKKIVGISFGKLYDNLLVADATLNITFDYDLADRLLTDVGKEGKDLREWVTSLDYELHRVVPYTEVVNNMKRAIERRFKVNLVEETLSLREEQVIRAGEQMRERFFV